MHYLIKNRRKHMFLHTEIDPGGMSVTWTHISYADEFATRYEAEQFVVRCKERYPNDEFDIVERRKQSA